MIRTDPRQSTGTPDGDTAANPARPSPSSSRRKAGRGPAGPETQRSGGQPGLIAIIIVLWVMIAAIVLTGTLIAAFAREHPAHFAAPLKIYPVTQQFPGQCPAGAQGVTAQGYGGPVCYQLTEGIMIKQVNDIHVERAKTGGYAVSITLIPADGKALERLTRAAAGRQFALTVRDQLVTAPRVDAPITRGHVLITGNLTGSQALGIVDRLKGRAAPSGPAPEPAPAPAPPPPTTNQPTMPGASTAPAQPQPTQPATQPTARQA